MMTDHGWWRLPSLAAAMGAHFLDGVSSHRPASGPGRTPRADIYAGHGRQRANHYGSMGACNGG